MGPRGGGLEPPPSGGGPDPRPDASSDAQRATRAHLERTLAPGATRASAMEDLPRTPDNEETGWNATGARGVRARGGAAPPPATSSRTPFAPPPADRARDAPGGAARAPTTRDAHSTLADPRTPRGLGATATESCPTHENLSALQLRDPPRASRADRTGDAREDPRGGGESPQSDGAIAIAIAVAAPRDDDDDDFDRRRRPVAASPPASSAFRPRRSARLSSSSAGSRDEPNPVGVVVADPKRGSASAHPDRDGDGDGDRDLGAGDLDLGASHHLQKSPPADLPSLSIPATPAADRREHQRSAGDPRLRAADKDASSPGSRRDSGALGSPPSVGEAARLFRVAETLRATGRAADALAVLDRVGALLFVDRAGGNHHAAVVDGRSNDSAAIGDVGSVSSPDALAWRCSRGACLHALGDLRGAFAAFTECLRHDPAHVGALKALGWLYQQRGATEEATETFKLALARAPADAELRRTLAATLTDLGTKTKLRGDPVGAIALYEEASAVDEAYAPTRYNLGVLYGELGRVDEAAARYAEATSLDPAHAEAHCNAGVLLRLAGDIDGAVAAYERCLAINPNHALGRGNVSVALVDRANAMKARGDLNGAIREYERALTYAPDSAEAMYNLGVAQAEAGESDRAIIAYETTLKLHPRCAEAWNNLGVVLREQNNLERALECYRAASALNPTFAQPLNNAGVLYTAQGHAGLAHEALSAAVHADPGYAVAHNNLGCLLRDTGDVPEALTCYERCARAEPDHRNATQNFLLGLNYVVPGEDPKVSDAHETWGRRFADLVRDSRLEERAFDPASDPEKIDPRSEDGSQGPARRLVVGYVSPDLYTHSVSYFASAPLRHHDARRFEVVVYSATPAPDARTASLRAAVESAHGRDAWRDVKDLTELELAELVRADGVDVLVELTGHTANNRLGAMARRPAPVQASWIGYPNSTGLAEVDYRITDRRCDPVGTKQTFAERLVRLPGCFLCYEPSPEAPASVAPAPCASAGFVTFGCFNALAKVTPEVRATWARVLRRVPNSRLLLKAKPFACATIKARFLAHMAALGVEPWRVDLAPLRPSTAEHLATYGFVDVALDTFPYAGTTTTCEAMHAGVPVVTLAGKCHAHNVGASLCEAAGVERECVAETEEEYVEKCAALASDFDALQELRGKMRGKMENGALCDGPAFVRKLEKAYEEMWRRWCDEKSAECEGGGEGRQEANARTRETTN